MTGRWMSRTGLPSRRQSFPSYVWAHKALYLMLLPGLINLALFKYTPMYGIVMAFEDFKVSQGYFGSQWVGLKHFANFLRDPFCFRIVRNTFILGFYTLLFGFPAPILLALIFNEVRGRKFKRIAQTISYMPNFISVVIVVSLLDTLFATKGGPVNTALLRLGLVNKEIVFMNSSQWFRTLYVGSGIWSNAGFQSIIYLAAMVNINMELYESADLDGASRLQKVWHVTLPSIKPTIMILFILAVGGILGNDMQKILLMYSPRCYATADVISTYVYRMGIEGASFSSAAAVGLLTNVVSVVFLLAANFISAKAGEISLL